ncbi:HAMP domain-containing sensor histidine kinase [Winogradskya consettensis]|uniref:histidine kinase n=1 Tax=Winogradskya consettensis TaxID=113560 RepID=A0A919SQS9_9ACTN|nr:HAMP domain-containing sensor histidine kinase [Actinoplanes consettensis]GIM75368.1 two-component sensor histidine kinase [Actinoplanes consettensis]
MPKRVPLRHSLVTRLLVTSVLIAVAAIAATAWLATTTATRAITQERGQSLTDDKGVYDMLIGYAATHADWSGAPALIDARAAKLGRRITLMTGDRAVIADSGPGGPSLRGARPSAEVDPLDLDLGLTGGTERIDARVVGPFKVAPADRNVLDKMAADQLNCLRKVSLDAKVVRLPSGRPTTTLTTPDPDGVASRCRQELAEATTKSEDKALTTLGQSVARCLGVQNMVGVGIRPDFTTYMYKVPQRDLPRTQIAAAQELLDVGATGRVSGCVEKSRQAQLRPYVAPPALLFVTNPATGTDQTTFTLSGENRTRVIGVTGAVLLATILATVLAGRRLVRPLRALTVAADGQTTAPVSTHDEIGRLARALNDSASRRDRAEAQRRAMVSDVAHELRTPLTNIRSWLEAAQDDLAPTDAQLLGLLHEEALLLQHIIDDLSDLAAADAGTLRIHPEPTPIRDVLTQAVESHRGTAHAAGVELVSLVRGDPVLPADAVRLRQLIGNLVSNAIRHTPPGGTVTVAAHQGTITVRDTGIGIAPENLPKIFDRFWRADESRSRATGGSGLGLAIARKIAEAHGGTIAVESEPDHGTLFTVTLPI